MEEITVKSGKGETAREPVTFMYEIGKDLEDAKRIFGEKIVYAMYKRGIVVAAQAPARQLLSAGADAMQIQEHMRTWKPGELAPRAARTGDPVAKFMMDFDNASVEKQAEMIASLQAMLNARPHPGEQATPSADTWSEPQEESPEDEFAADDDSGDEPGDDSASTTSRRRHRR
jgi:hypothetical protein